ncbi:MAG: hypothetical protein QNJ63_28910, partial [Calothrix sp. MO_192.B10]|nr:hypothetical protein [Calothrix sp. MO_192.B10]
RSKNICFDTGSARNNTSVILSPQFIYLWGLSFYFLLLSFYFLTKASAFVRQETPADGGTSEDFPAQTLLTYGYKTIKPSSFFLLPSSM